MLNYIEIEASEQQAKHATPSLASVVGVFFHWIIRCILQISWFTHQVKSGRQLLRLSHEAVIVSGPERVFDLLLGGLDSGVRWRWNPTKAYSKHLVCAVLDSVSFLVREGNLLHVFSWIYFPNKMELFV